MIHTFIAEHWSDLPVSTCCRVMKVSTSGFYQRRRQPVTDTELVEAYAANEGVCCRFRLTLVDTVDHAASVAVLAKASSNSAGVSRPRRRCRRRRL